jgi:two-component system sensor histidine kinase KdpD
VVTARRLDELAANRTPVGRLGAPRSLKWPSYAGALLAVAAATAVSFAIFPHLDLANVVMVYLLAVVVVAAKFGTGPAVVGTVVSVATFVYLFVPHYYSFVLSDLRYLPTFIVMLCVGLLVSTLTARLRAEALATHEREVRAHALYQLSRGLAEAETRASVAEVVRRHVLDVFRCPSRLLECVEGSKLEPAGGSAGEAPLAPMPVEVAQRALRERAARGHEAGAGSPGFLFLPMVVANEPVGVLAVQGLDAGYIGSLPHRRLLDAFANNAAIALHRLMVGDEARRTQQRIDQERLRNVMLSSMSHDFRTPLASITGAVTTLLENEHELDAPTRRELMQSIREDAESLERQIRNLLDLTKLEAGNLQIRWEWHPLDEVIGCAMTRVERVLGHRRISIDVAPTLPLVRMDAQLIEQLLVNLLENAARYAPPGSPIEVSVVHREPHVRITVADRGPGIPVGEHERVFAKFYRAAGSRPHKGVGLGLAICRAIATLHAARVWVEDRPGGGALFLVDLPTGGAPPASGGSGIPAEAECA